LVHAPAKTTVLAGFELPRKRQKSILAPPNRFKMKRLLFLCSQNKLRSPTAEAIFSNYEGIEVDSAGLNNDAVVPLSEEQVEWADVIIVMEKSHRNRLSKKFKPAVSGKSVVVLGIPDEYDYMDDELIRLLKVRCRPYLPVSTRFL
jgi:predicted protein tyrosine phosphatase